VPYSVPAFRFFSRFRTSCPARSVRRELGPATRPANCAASACSRRGCSAFVSDPVPACFRFSATFSSGGSAIAEWQVQPDWAGYVERDELQGAIAVIDRRAERIQPIEAFGHG